MIDWIAGLDPRAFMVGTGLVGLLLAVPLEIAAFRRMRRLQLGRGTLFFFRAVSSWRWRPAWRCWR